MLLLISVPEKGTTPCGTAGRLPTAWSWAGSSLRSAHSPASPSTKPNYAPVLTAARSTLHDVEFSNPRWGSAELYGSGWQSVRIDGGKLDYVNLRGSRLADVLVSDCIINELDLGSATAARVALRNCTIGSLDLSGATLQDFDLRGTDLRSISGLGNLAGVVIDDHQLGLIAPLLAAHLGLVVA